MICPNCNKEIKEVNVYSLAQQKAVLDGNKIIHYGGVEILLDTEEIECPECFTDITNSVEE